MPLNNEQKQAVEYLEGPLLVLAGPGTGKTQLLSSKVAYILENTDASPENILCITFTDSATANMRDRLTSIIGSDAHHVNIHTYHALGTDILHAYQNYSTTYTRPFDNPIDEVTAYKIINNLIGTLNPFDPLRANSVKDILSTISSAKKARLTPKDLIKISHHNKTAGAQFTPPISDLILKLRTEKIKKYDIAVEAIYTPILEILTQYISKDPIAGRIAPLANQLAIDLKQAIDAGAQNEKGKTTVKPLTDWYKTYFELAPSGDYRLKDYVANLKLESLARIYEAYEAYLKENNLYDFDDMIEEAVATLEKDEGFRLSLSEKYQYILLDEFQDTNPSQFKIIELLTDYEKPIIMAVGDDDQTIFEFQGARPDNLLYFQNKYHAKIINLHQNYRSTTEIVNLGRKIAEQIPDSFEKQMNIQKQLIAVRSTSDPVSHIRRLEFTSADAEYDWLATEINRLITAGESPSCIGIITPQHKYIQPLLPYLKDKNIPIAYEKTESILDDPKIKELTTLSSFIDSLAKGDQPSHQLLEILSYPFWEIPAISITQQITRDRKKPTLDYLLNSSDQKIQQVGELLSELVVRATITPLEQFLDQLIGILPIKDNLTSPYLSYYSTTIDYFTFNLYNHLHILREKIISHTSSNTPTLSDFVAMIQDYQSAGASITSTSPYQDNDNSVQIMTVHKSKGLEFKHVYLIAVDDTNWGNASGNKNLLSLPKNLLSIRQDGTSESELHRKFFVAITRAETYLTMTNSLKNFAGKTPPRLEYLKESTASDGSLASPLIPSGTIETHYEDIDSAKLRTDLHLGWLAHYYTLTPNLKKLLLKRLESYKISASDLTSFIDIIYAGPQEFYKNKILRAPEQPNSDSLNLGNIMHATFEKVTKEKVTDQAALDFCRQQIAELNITPQEKTELEVLATTSLEKSLKKFSHIIRNPHSQAEFSFYSEHPTLENIPLSGTIDHFNIDEKSKTIEIYDFKTSKHHPGKWQSRTDTTLYKYRLQLGFYKLLLNLSPTFSKYQVTKGHILFVKPDTDGEVYDEVYEYNQTDEAELKKLIRTVYHHIKTLDYLENPEINLAKNENLSYKDFFNFIAKLLQPEKSS